ncbi:hypothetical protein SISNIDRAFT_38483 [Sistotremastrum niveocremeum HHB9708]|uniref:Uncharacterized protein n=2 Tax=Sistotremastraceae TaxID=3402574 RepID=A0A164VPI9_9AGAM|nr:hypothetical protein SISNIDRAFT_38483 [Sistotremastrum niveocremeum HHB9708]KZT37922.1 hypothetical protein SISSUDRAFT_807800 [Sistotremastrum suecicum HHB10207 ss-3]
MTSMTRETGVWLHLAYPFALLPTTKGRLSPFVPSVSPFQRRKARVEELPCVQDSDVLAISKSSPKWHKAIRARRVLNLVARPQKMYPKKTNSLLLILYSTTRWFLSSPLLSFQ